MSLGGTPPKTKDKVRYGISESDMFALIRMLTPKGW
jgi:hypothetical protein